MICQQVSLICSRKRKNFIKNSKTCPKNFFAFMADPPMSRMTDFMSDHKKKNLLLYALYLTSPPEQCCNMSLDVCFNE